MKVRQKNMNGEIVTESVGDAVARVIGQAGGHGYGQMEQLQAELDETQQILIRLCDIVSDALDEDDIYRLLGHEKGHSFSQLEVIKS